MRKTLKKTIVESVLSALPNDVLGALVKRILPVGYDLKDVKEVSVSHDTYSSVLFGELKKLHPGAASYVVTMANGAQLSFDYSPPSPPTPLQPVEVVKVVTSDVIASARHALMEAGEDEDDLREIKTKTEVVVRDFVLEPGKTKFKAITLTGAGINFKLNDH